MNLLQRSLLLGIVFLSTFQLTFSQSDTLNRTDKYGKKYGYWKTYDQGVLKWEGRFYNGEPIGTVIHYYSNGKTESVLQYYLNSPKVDAVLFHKNGERASEGSFINKKKDGKWVYFNERKTLISEETWNNGLLNGSNKTYSPSDGTLLEEFNWLNGKLNGIYNAYYTNGQLRVSMNYKNSKMHGDYKTYYPDGKIYKTGTYNENLFEGTWTLFNPEGEQLKIQEYSQGRVTKTLLGFQTSVQWLVIDAKQIAYFFYQGDKLLMQLFNKQLIEIQNTSLAEISSISTVELFVFVGGNILSSYNAIRGTKETVDQEGEKQITVKLSPAPSFDVVLSGDDYLQFKQTINFDEPETDEY